MVEIGPRFVLNPVRIFRGSFGGQTLYKNPDFVSPNEIRAAERRNKGSAYMDRKNQQKRRKIRKEELVVPEDPLDSVFRWAYLLLIGSIQSYNDTSCCWIWNLAAIHLLVSILVCGHD